MARSSNPKGKGWIPVKAVRMLANGSVQIKVARGTRRNPETETMYRLYGIEPGDVRRTEFGIFPTHGEAQEKYEELRDRYPSNFRFFIKPTKVKKHAHGIQRVE